MSYNDNTITISISTSELKAVIFDAIEGSNEVCSIIRERWEIELYNEGYVHYNSADISALLMDFLAQVQDAQRDELSTDIALIYSDLKGILKTLPTLNPDQESIYTKIKQVCRCSIT